MLNGSLYLKTLRFNADQVHHHTWLKNRVSVVCMWYIYFSTLYKGSGWWCKDIATKAKKRKMKTSTRFHLRKLNRKIQRSVKWMKEESNLMKYYLGTYISRREFKTIVPIAILRIASWHVVLLLFLMRITCSILMSLHFNGAYWD